MLYKNTFGNIFEQFTKYSFSFDYFFFFVKTKFLGHINIVDFLILKLPVLDESETT